MRFVVAIITKENDISLVNDVLLPYSDKHNLKVFINSKIEQEVVTIRKVMNTSISARSEIFERDFNLINIFEKRNPDALFSEHCIGGKWKDYFFLKNGGRAHAALIDDIIIREPLKRIQAFSHYWDNMVDDIPFPKKSEYSVIAGPSRDELLSFYKTKEAYCMSKAYFIPSFFVTPDGQWCVASGINDSNFSLEELMKRGHQFRKFLESHKNDYITLVECVV